MRVTRPNLGVQWSKSSRRKIRKPNSKPAHLHKPPFVSQGKEGCGTPASFRRASGKIRCRAEGCPPARKESSSEAFFYVAATLRELRARSRDPQSYERPAEQKGWERGVLNPHPLQQGKTQRMRHPQSRIAARLECGVRRKAEPPAIQNYPGDGGTAVNTP
jgi:hypothetical protein